MDKILKQVKNKQRTEMVSLSFQCDKEKHNKIQSLAKEYNVSLTKFFQCILYDFVDKYDKKSK